MNPSDSNPGLPAPKPRRRLWKWLGFSALGFFVLSVAGIASLFFLDGDAAVLRDGLRDSHNPLALKTRVQLSLGPISLGLARLVISEVNSVDEDAKVALSSVRSASVGVYDLSDRDAAASPDFSRLDERMRDCGWRRWVMVRKHGELVVVYGPSELGWSRTLPLCIGVKQANKLVVVYLRGDPEPLLELANRHGGNVHISGTSLGDRLANCSW